MIRSPVAGSRKGAPRRRRGWRAALFAPLLFLATCGPAADTEIRFAGPAPPHPMPEATAAVAHFTDSDFIADDGARLPLHKWLPQDRVTAVILALHGFGDYGLAFAMPAAVWAERGIATYAFDQRGFGGAPDRGLWPGEGRLVVDAIVASRILRQIHPGRPLYLLGESMGGAVAVLAMTGAMSGVVPGPGGMPLADADGVVLSAPAVWGRQTMDFLPKLALFAGVRLFPDTVLSGRGLRILASDNLPMLRALARDPMVLKGARLDTVYGLVDLMDSALAASARLRCAALVMYGAHDALVPRRPIAEFVAQLPPDTAQHRRLAYYPQGYHLLLRDLDGAAVADDVANWIRDHATPLPSGTDAQRGPWPPRPDGER